MKVYILSQYYDWEGYTEPNPTGYLTFEAAEKAKNAFGEFTTNLPEIFEITIQEENK